MNNKFVRRFTLLFSLGFSGTAFSLSPDIISYISSLGPAELNAAGYYLVPAQIRIRNSGNDLAGRFKMNAEVRASGEPWRLVPFHSVHSSTRFVSGDGYYAWTRGVLNVGREVTFSVTVAIPREYRGRWVEVRVWADSCAAEEFMPDYCRLSELSEVNNFAVPFRVLVP